MVTNVALERIVFVGIAKGDYIFILGITMLLYASGKPIPTEFTKQISILKSVICQGF